MKLQELKNLYTRSQNIGTQKAVVLKSLERLKYDTFTLSKMPRQIKVNHLQYYDKIPKEVNVTVHPQNTATVYKKVKNPITGEFTKVPSKVNIGHSVEDGSDVFHFLENKTDKEIGYVKLFNSKNVIKDGNYYDYYETTKFSYNYPGYGISKDRVLIDMAYNNSEGIYGGMGKVVDQLAVEYCLKNNIKPGSIISEASFNSHCQHYKRGRRFIKTDDKDVNKIVEKRINESLPGEIIQSDDLGDVLMYFPKKLVKRCLEEIKRNPILKVF